MSRIVYVDGQYLPEHEATVSIFDRGFLFGDSIYEVSAVINGRLIDAAAHLARLDRSCGEIKLGLTWSRDELIAIHEELIERNGLVDGGIYLQVTRGAADRNFPFPARQKPTLVMFTQARSITREISRGYALKSVPDQRWARCDIKSTALLAQVLAKQAAAEAGCDEALMLEEGVVTEGGSSTIWIVKGRSIITRPLSSKVLAGITRDAVLTYVAETGFTFEERVFTLQEALDADEVFITAATALIMPATEIDGHPIGDGQPGPVALRLRNIYFDLAERGGALG